MGPCASRRIRASIAKARTGPTASITQSRTQPRDVTMLVVSRAPYAKPKAYGHRIGWHFQWLSSVVVVSTSTTAFRYATGWRQSARFREGISVFVRGCDGSVFRAYSAYARGHRHAETSTTRSSTWCPRAAIKVGGRSGSVAVTGTEGVHRPPTTAARRCAHRRPSPNPPRSTVFYEDESLERHM